MTIVVAAGGTGGHLYPAVALARAFLRRDPATTVLFVGTSRGLEAKVLAHEGFELEFITAKPVMGKGVADAIRGLAALPAGLWQSLRLLRRRRADLVVGVGGYTSPAMVTAAALGGIARVILEPNAYPGMANKAVAPLAQRIFLAFESAATSFPRSKVRVVGTPVRQEFLAQAAGNAETAASFGGRLLVFGGSQGARAVNDAMLAALSLLKARLPQMVITHQTGEADYRRVADAYRQAGVTAEVAPYLYEMPSALRAADLVVARAGAMTVAELTACGKPAVLIPLPTAIYDHQMQNARAMEAAGGALVLPQSEAVGRRLGDVICELMQDPARLRRMGEASRRMRRTDAAEAIVRECYDLMGEPYDTNRTVGATGR